MSTALDIIYYVGILPALLLYARMLIPLLKAMTNDDDTDWAHRGMAIASALIPAAWWPFTLIPILLISVLWKPIKRGLERVLSTPEERVRSRDEELEAARDHVRELERKYDLPTVEVEQ